MAMPTSTTKRLLLATKRAAGNEAVPIGPYEEETLQVLASESVRLHKDMEELLEGKEYEELPEGVKATLFVHQRAIERNRECGLYYLQSRCSTLCDLRMEFGLALPEQIRNNMSQAEAAFFRDYDAIYSDFIRDVRLDLNSHKRPPTSLYIEVRAKADIGEVATEHSGIVNFEKGSVHYLRASDVEHLLDQGLLEQVA